MAVAGRHGERSGGDLTFGRSPGIVGAVNDDSAKPLGEWLRQRREELGIDLAQAQTDTRIRVQYLQALEAEEFAALPNPVVGRGFLRNYATYLTLDTQDALDRFTRRSGTAPAADVALEAELPSGAGPFHPVLLHKAASPRPNWLLPVGLLVAVVAALSLLAWWGYPTIADWVSSQRLNAKPNPTVRATAPVVAIASRTSTRPATPTTATGAQPTPTVQLTWTPTSRPSPSPTPSQPVYTGIFLELVFTDTSWIQVTVDGVREFQGELETGTYRSWYGEEKIELRVGNAGGVEVTINGQKLGALGRPGEVADQVFEMVGNEVAAATATPPSAETPGAEETAAPEVTPTLALTPTPPSVDVTATAPPTVIEPTATP